METDLTNNPNSLFGAWTLRTFQIIVNGKPDSTPFGPNPIGTMIYNSSLQFSAQVMKSDRPTFKSDNQFAAEPDEIQSGFLSYVGYFGVFKINTPQTIIEHNVIGAVFPNWTNTIQRRKFRFENNGLTLETLPIVDGDGRSIIKRFCWSAA